MKRLFGFILRAFGSPLAVLFFFIIPVIVFTQRYLHLPSISPTVLFVNNVLFLIYLGIKLIYYIKRLPKGIRYKPWTSFPKKKVEIFLNEESVQRTLMESGYVFDSKGAYGEKKDWGYRGALIAYAGLFLILTFGTYDNLRQFSGTILLGVGEPLKLYKGSSYSEFVNGVLASPEDINMKLQIKKQIFLSPEWPQGATELVLLSREGKELKRGIIAPEKPIRERGMDIHMAKFLFDAWVVITTLENHIIYTNWVRLVPLREKSGDYTYYGVINNDFMKVQGGVWFDLAKNRLKVEVKWKGDKIVDVVLGRGPEYKKEVGGYRVKLEGLGRWSEIHVVRKRHKGMLLTGGIMFAFGLLMRVVFRPKRVWIEGKGQGTLVGTTDRDAIELLKRRGAENPMGKGT